MKTTEIEYLIENAEQGSEPQEIEAGKEARKELNALLKALVTQQSAQADEAYSCSEFLHGAIVSETDNKFCSICGKRLRR